MTVDRVFADPLLDRDPELAPELAARLAALAPTAAPAPLVIPARRPRTVRRLRPLLAAAALLVALVGAATSPGRALVRTIGEELGLLSVVRSPAPVPAAPGAAAPALPAYAVGSVVHLPSGRTIRLRLAVAGPYLGDDTTLAALLPGGRSLIYTAWDRRAQRSDLRRVDLASGADTLYVRGAMGVVVRPDGAVAYFRSRPAAAGRRMPLDGDLWVRASADAAPVRWTSARRNWRPVAWSGSRLLAVDDHDAGGRRAYLLPRPGAARRVLLFGAPRADGGRLVGTPDPGGDASTLPVVELADAAGRSLARLDLRRVAALRGSDATRIGPTAFSWLGDGRVLAAAGDELLALDVAGDAVHLVTHHRLAAARLVAGGTETDIARIVPLDREGRYVAVSVSAGSGSGPFRYGIANCDLAAGTCVLGRELAGSAVLLPDPAAG